MKSALFYLSLLCSYLPFAQDLMWLDHMGTGAGYEGIDVVTTDESGNVYAGATFAVSTDFDPSAGTINFTGFGYVDAIISKFDASGNILWAKQFGGNDYDQITDLIVDNAGNVYACGYFSSTNFDADPGAGVQNLAGNAEQAWILKLDTDGNLVWAYGLGSTGTDKATVLDFDTNGNIVIGGTFANTVDFNFGAGTANLTALAAGSGFVLKIMPDAVFVSAIAIGNTVSSLKITEFGELHVAGEFTGVCDLDPSAGVNFFSSSGTQNGYVCRLSPTNSLVWARAFYGDGYITVDDLATGENGDAVVLLTFDTNIALDPNSGVFTPTSALHDAAIVSLYKFTGDHKWSNVISGTGQDLGCALVTDDQGFVYYSVNFDGTVDANPGSAVLNFATFGYYDMLISRLAPDGAFSWAHQLGSVYSEVAWNLHCDANENFYASGMFNGTVDFDMGPGIADYTSTGSNADAFLGRYTACSPVTATINDIGCDSYLSPSGSYTWTNSGTYMDTLTSLLNYCDSIVTCNITIVEIDTTIVQTGATLSVNETGGTYQWYNCIGNTAISGATGQTFAPASNGSYFVTVNVNGCVDTSACYSLNDLGISNVSDFECSVFPNPCETFMQLTYKGRIASFRLLDLTGKEVLTGGVNASSPLEINLSGLNSGCYILQVINEENQIINLKINKK